jgi:hypothetical protein
MPAQIETASTIRSRFHPGIEASGAELHRSRDYV